MTKQASPDVFISYASEDREAVAKPLAELLAALGIKVWFDQFNLKIGDSLRRKIDEGLATCEYGIVILSPSFFGKHYTNRELDGLAQREVDGKKVILPIWVGIDEKQVRQFSPPLADRIAARWEEGIASVVTQIIQAIKPEVLELLNKKVIPLQRLTNGKEVVDVFIGAHFSFSHHDEPNSEAEIDLVGGFLQALLDWRDIWEDIEIPEQMRTVSHITEMVNELKTAGWTVYGRKMKGKRKLAGIEDQWIWCAIAVLRSKPEQVVFMDDKIIVLRGTIA